MAKKRQLDTLTATIHALTPKPGKKFFELGRALWHLFRDYPDQVESIIKSAKVDRRTAYYLAEVAKKLAPFMQYEDRMRLIGWTKLSLLADLVTPDNIQEWLFLAETKNTKQLSKLTTRGDASEGLRTVTLDLTPQQYRRYARAITKSGGSKRGKQLLNQGVALMAILSAAGM